MRANSALQSGQEDANLVPHSMMHGAQNTCRHESMEATSRTASRQMAQVGPGLCSPSASPAPPAATAPTARPRARRDAVGVTAAMTAAAPTSAANPSRGRFGKGEAAASLPSRARRLALKEGESALKAFRCGSAPATTVGEAGCIA